MKQRLERMNSGDKKINSSKIIDAENIKVLAFDLDGTLLAPGSLLTERTRKAVCACAARGIQIIIATGRAIESTEKFRTALGISGPMVYFNGAVVANMPSGKILSSVLLNNGAADYCIDLSRRKGMYFQAYFLPAAGEKDITLMAEIEGPYRDLYAHHTGLHIKIGNLKEALKNQGKQGCIKGMFLAEEQVLDGLRLELKEHFGDSVYLVRSMASFLEVLNAGVSKGTGLTAALESLNLKKEQAIAFGDEENDLPMFKAASYSVAPANAAPAVRAAADFITPSNSEDGIAAFLEELLESLV